MVSEEVIDIWVSVVDVSGSIVSVDIFGGFVSVIVNPHVGINLIKNNVWNY